MGLPIAKRDRGDRRSHRQCAVAALPSVRWRTGCWAR